MPKYLNLIYGRKGFIMITQLVVFLKILKTNILLINTILTDKQGYLIGSFVYYNDISKNEDNIINAIKHIIIVIYKKFQFIYFQSQFS
ncbi:transmembrane protein, putative (macronuclear) [Tetrahymena thermophila SB210]|uniref:Transmembrane protein, putative n=1 Tax=Tetrahymena thermophila (strain SB210) TaxID=312017 RepID=W7XBL4_TETTS|nr:transmembrane protein, putative [Tetrahymena thermophila SB210]EWS71071.1 transmembrane protein, putative [Tetrahymena thermophila SB210]|eukprot:XP_012656370.1 transmembrane protein, putative [Tetrahymena thermophila SB210]